MNKFFSLDEYEFFEKSKDEKNTDIKYSISLHHALFDSYLGEHFGNESMKSLLFFQKIFTENNLNYDAATTLINLSMHKNKFINDNFKYTKRYRIATHIINSTIYIRDHKDELGEDFILKYLNNNVINVDQTLIENIIQSNKYNLIDENFIEDPFLLLVEIYENNSGHLITLYFEKNPEAKDMNEEYIIYITNTGEGVELHPKLSDHELKNNLCAGVISKKCSKQTLI